MSQGYNRVTLFGNLGAEPELRRLPSGTSLLRMRVATNHSWMKDGVREDRTEWHLVVMWGNRAEGLARILRKGSLVLVEGQLRTHSYEKDGDKRYLTEIHADDLVLGGRNRGHDAGGDPDRYAEAGSEAAARFDEDTRPESEMHPDARSEPDSRPEPDSQPESDGRPSPELEPAPIAPKAPRGGDGGAAQVDLPPPPARKRTRSPAPAPAMASAA